MLRKIIGHCMIGAVFVGIFGLAVMDIGLEGALLTGVGVLVVVGWLIMACNLIEG